MRGQRDGKRTSKASEIGCRFDSLLIVRQIVLANDNLNNNKCR